MSFLFNLIILIPRTLSLILKIPVLKSVNTSIHLLCPTIQTKQSRKNKTNSANMVIGQHNLKYFCNYFVFRACPS